MAAALGADLLGAASPEAPAPEAGSPEAPAPEAEAPDSPAPEPGSEGEEPRGGGEP
jgi:hypothetical protein